MDTNRRNWLRNAAGLLVAAPFVVRSSVLMPVKPLISKGSTDLGSSVLEHTDVDLYHGSMDYSYTDEDGVVRYLTLSTTNIGEAWRQIDNQLGPKADGGILTLGKGEFTLGDGFSLPKWYTADRKIEVVEPETWVRGEIPLRWGYLRKKS